MNPSVVIPGASNLKSYAFNLGGEPNVNVRHELRGANPPNINDDEVSGFYRGSVWINGSDVWICVDNSEKSAVWNKLAIGGGDVTVDQISDASALGKQILKAQTPEDVFEILGTMETDVINGKDGGLLITGTALVNTGGPWRYLYVSADAKFHTLTGNLTGVANATIGSAPTIPQFTPLWGTFTAIQLHSGSVFAYKSPPAP